jgi:hypothetical protein
MDSIQITLLFGWLVAPYLSLVINRQRRKAMSANISIDTGRFHRRTGAMRKLTGSLFAALLLSAVPASAAGFVTHDAASVSRPTDAGVKGDSHSLSPLPLRIDIPMVPRPIAGLGNTGNSPIADTRWAAGATSEWHAGMNRAVDRLVAPPENVNVYAAQTEDHLNSNLEGPHGPINTLAGFEIVIH